VSDIRYLLDENVEAAIASGLKARIPHLEIERVGLVGAPALKTPDPEILRWCEANQFILVTKNRSTMPVHLRDHIASGGHVPGILVLSEDMPIGQVIEELALIHGASGPEEHVDQLHYLPLR
jgi:hypothetical protein